MPNIQINIKNKVARADRAIIVCDNSDYTAVFDFDDEWSAYETKTARFVYCGTYTDAVFTGNSCPIPEIHDTRSLTIGVYAGDLHTTTPAYISCVPSILCGNGIPADPTPDVYNQLMELLNKDSGVWYPAVDDAGNMSWTRSISETAPQPVNIKGADGKDYVLTDTDKQEIAKTAAGLVDVPSVQPDWNQNDTTKPDYVKNRPFYTGDPVKTVLVEEQTVAFSAMDGVYAIQGWPTNFDAVVGKTYTVSWDGTEYECECLSMKSLPYIGNLAVAGAEIDTGEPFIFMNQGVWVVGTNDTASEHIIEISSIAKQIIKIDKKYLPDNLATKSDVEAAQTTAENAQTTAENAKSDALDLAARMFGHTSVVDNAFKYDKTLSITSLPACITSIGSYAFSGCTNLALTSLPSGVTEIGMGAFSGCTQLALTSLPDGLTTIETNAFSGCTQLALTSLPDGLTSIKGGAFSGCTQLALTSLPSGLTEIVGSAFYGCGQLALTSLPSGLTEIDTYTFYYCTNLALTSLPSGITSIGNYAFYGCTNLTSITFTGTPTSIGSNAFSGCTNLTTINVPWAEGKVANAPWGATNATINYNYTEA